MPVVAFEVTPAALRRTVTLVSALAHARLVSIRRDTVGFLFYRLHIPDDSFYDRPIRGSCGVRPALASGRLRGPIAAALGFVSLPFR